LLTGFDPDFAACVRIDLAEQLQLHLAREEAVLLARERSAIRLGDVALGDAGDEVAGDAHVEEQLARAALLVERERLARPEQLLSAEAGATPGPCCCIVPGGAGWATGGGATGCGAGCASRRCSRSVKPSSCLRSCSISRRSAPASCASAGVAISATRSATTTIPDARMLSSPGTKVV